MQYFGIIILVLGKWDLWYTVHYAYIMFMEDHDWLVSSAQHFVY